MRTLARPAEYSRHPERAPLVDNTFRIRPEAKPLLQSDEVSAQYTGFGRRVEGLAIIHVTDDGQEREWIVTRHAARHAAEMQPEAGKRPKHFPESVGKHALSAVESRPIAQVTEITSEFDADGRRVVSAKSADVYPDEGLTLDDLRQGVLTSHQVPSRSMYAKFGNGVISANEKGGVVINSFVEPDVIVMASQEAEHSEAARILTPIGETPYDPTQF